MLQAAWSAKRENYIPKSQQEPGFGVCSSQNAPDPTSCRPKPTRNTASFSQWRQRIDLPFNGPSESGSMVMVASCTAAVLSLCVIQCVSIFSYGSPSFNGPYTPVSKPPDLCPIRSYLFNLPGFRRLTLEAEKFQKDFPPADGIPDMTHPLKCFEHCFSRFQVPIL